MHTNIKYDYARLNTNKDYKNSEETLTSKKGLCGELGYLYVAMTRCCGLESQFVYVTKDYRGREVIHGCGGVYLENRLVQVDPSYRKYDIKHQRIEPQNDLKAMIRFNQYRLKKNYGNFYYKVLELIK